MDGRDRARTARSSSGRRSAPSTSRHETASRRVYPRRTARPIAALSRRGAGRRPVEPARSRRAWSHPRGPACARPPTARPARRPRCGATRRLGRDAHGRSGADGRHLVPEAHRQRAARDEVELLELLVVVAGALLEVGVRRYADQRHRELLGAECLRERPELARDVGAGVGALDLVGGDDREAAPVSPCLLDTARRAKAKPLAVAPVRAGGVPPYFIARATPRPERRRRARCGSAFRPDPLLASAAIPATIRRTAMNVLSCTTPARCTRSTSDVPHCRDRGAAAPPQDTRFGKPPQLIRHGAARLARVRHGLARVGSPLVKTAQAASTGCLCAIAALLVAASVAASPTVARRRAAAASDEGDGAVRQGPHRGRRDDADDERAVRGRRAGADHRRLVTDARRLPGRVRQGRRQVGHGAERRRQLPYRGRQQDVHRDGDPASSPARESWL